ncbi:MAG: VOC family protein [Acidimicrobiia bacterium]|jgi:catechol-2,3-dioxygenase
MAIHRLNHAVLYVRDAEQSADFYCEILGFRRLPAGIPGAVFLRAAGSSNDHDLGLFSVGENAVPSAAGRGAVGLYHLAWEVDTLADLHDLALKLREAGALVGASDHGSTKALYGRDPDGIDFEIAWLVPADLLGDEETPKTAPLDLAKEIETFGAETLGGIGVSREQPMEVRR